MSHVMLVQLETGVRIWPRSPRPFSGLIHLLLDSSSLPSLLLPLAFSLPQTTSSQLSCPFSLLLCWPAQARTNLPSPRIGPACFRVPTKVHYGILETLGSWHKGLMPAWGVGWIVLLGAQKYADWRIQNKR